METVEKVRPEYIRGFFEVGESYVCDENTYAPRHAGTAVEITSDGRSVAEGRILSGPNRGEVFHWGLPVTVRDSVRVDDDSATYLLGKLGRTAGHSVTWRRLGPGECPECGDVHDWYGYPDEFGNRFVEELGVCSNCAGTA